MNEFYVGYLPKAPSALARRTRAVAVLLVLLGAGLAAALVFAQQPFAAAKFEFLEWREFTGIVEEQPYPALVVAHPGGESRYLLVAPGKHGGGDLVRGLNGQKVELRAQLIYRDQHTMLEVDPDSILVAPEPPVSPIPAAAPSAAPVTLTGEIVDTKCYFGVMNPGEGKVHRDCAARCVAGGIPPALLTADGSLYLLVGLGGTPIRAEDIAAFIAEPVTVIGRPQMAPRLLLFVDSIQRAQGKLSKTATQNGAAGEQHQPGFDVHVLGRAGTRKGPAAGVISGALAARAR